MIEDPRPSGRGSSLGTECSVLLTLRPMRMRGTWPGRVTMRSGWAKAMARPWNDTSPDAALRLERGSAEFLSQCAAQLCSKGVNRVLSPPLDRSLSKVWADAGFEQALVLDLHRRSLVTPIPQPDHHVEDGSERDWSEAARIDEAAFAPAWRMGSLGLEEARQATPNNRFLVTRDGDRLTGFAIAGQAMSTAYLQRIAVDPADHGAGYGRSLVRATCRWASQRGAVAIILNTQPDNEAAAGLYRSEGFEVTKGALAVLGKAC